MDLKTISKAIAGFLGGAVVAYLADKGIVLDPKYADAINLLLGGAITAVIVYFAPKNKA